MRTRDELVAHIAAGKPAKFIFFWGHTPKGSILDAACLSQWFPRAFNLNGVQYQTAEHYMMAEKARLFADVDALAQVLAAASPGGAKAAGRAVRGYDDDAWKSARFDAVVRGNIGKFGQHADLREYLVTTGDRILVEASPRDTIWGIGLGASNENARDPSRWRGQNLLGFALMEARRTLRG